jgi:hypothetical protein
MRLSLTFIALASYIYDTVYLLVGLRLELFLPILHLFEDGFPLAAESFVLFLEFFGFIKKGIDFLLDLCN